MPLLKLWNSIRGRSNPANGEETAATQAQSAPPSAAKSEPSASRGFGLFRGPHAGLCKSLKTVAATSLLEIGVGDGTRAVAMLETLSKQGQDVRYLALDQFEMAGGDVTLKQFHQSLRAHDIRPQVYPQDIENGLLRIAHTIGTVDLIVIGTNLAEWQTPAVTARLSRVAHKGTVILYLDGEAWRKYTLAEPVEFRRAG